MCKLIWTVHLPRTYARMYYVSDGVYVAYDEQGTAYIIHIDGSVHEYYRDFGDAISIADYEYSFIVRDMICYFHSLADGMIQLCVNTESATKPMGAPFDIGNYSRAENNVIMILWRSDTDIITDRLAQGSVIIKRGATLAGVTFEC